MRFIRFYLLCSFVLLLCTSGRAQRPSFETVRDSLRGIIDTASTDKGKFLQYIRTFNAIPTRDTALVATYEDTLLSFQGKVEDDYFTALYGFQKLRALRYQRKFEDAKAYVTPTVAAYKRLDSVHFRPSIGRTYQIGTILGLATQDYGYAHDQATLAVSSLRGVAGEEGNLAGALSNFGSILQQTGLHEEALVPLRESEKIYRELKRPERYFNPVMNQGNCHLALDNLDSAQHYYRLALVAIDEQPRPNAGQRAYIQNNLAGIYEKEGRLTEARDELLSASAVFEKLGAWREYTASAASLANIYNKLDLPLEALRYGRAALAHSGPYTDINQEVLKTQAGTFIKLSVPDSAAYYLDAFVKANNERNEKELEKSVANAEAKFHNTLKQEEIDRLALEDELSQQQIQSQRWMLIGALVVLGILGYLAYSLFRQRQRISAQNATISRALTDKEVLLKEIHHRVKNNLQMVSSLLSLQGRYLEDDGAKAALKMGNSRVRSMALIHQKLYLRDEVNTSVEAREYLEKLVEELVANLSRPDLDLSLNIDIMDTEMDIDRMIPVGLIVNELVTNTLKYAFTDRSVGSLSVSLHLAGTGYRLTVEDDGVGMPQERGTSFGLSLVESLVGQLGGDLNMDGSGGTRATIAF